MKPLIGITVNHTSEDTLGITFGSGLPGQGWNSVAQDYAAAVEQAGGIPVLLPAMASDEDYAALLEKLDGILFSGGADINPNRYGEDMICECGKINPDRDEYEFRLMALAAKSQLPILCICRGTQLLNVFHGGSLVQHMPHDGLRNHSIIGMPRTEGSHWANITPGSLLHSILGEERVHVNSYHHQCIKAPGNGIVVTAISDDNTPEAIEMPERAAFTLGVQWHPEMMHSKNPLQCKIFKAFVDAASI